MTSRCSNGTRGFTLIEMAIVLTLSGLLMAVAFTTYTTYIKKQRATESYDKQQIIASTLPDYSSTQHPLPCPAAPQRRFLQEFRRLDRAGGEGRLQNLRQGHKRRGCY